MRKILKVLGIILASAIVLLTLFYFYADYSFKKRIATEYIVEPEDLSISNDSASIANGKHLVAIKGCADCHGENLAGRVFNDDLMVGKLAGPNLTYGKGGLGEDFKITDYVLALKHGLNRHHTPLLVMPSVETSQMSKEDMGDIIAYLKSLPPIDNTMPKSSLGIMITMLAYFDQVPVVAAEKIDHNAALVPAVDKSSKLAYGKYLSAMCSGCHRDNMKGGDPLAPGFPPVPDLTSSGTAGRWNQQQFNSTLRTGKRPDGTELDPSMPWPMTKHYTDEELEALYTYFKSL